MIVRSANARPKRASENCYITTRASLRPARTIPELRTKVSLFFAKRCRPGEKNQVFQTLSFLPGTVRPRDCGDGSLNVSLIPANDQGQDFRRAANCPTFNSGFLWLRLQAALT